MYPTKSTQEAQTVSQRAPIFIGLTILGAAVIIGRVALQVQAWPHLPFFVMLTIAVLSSRLKLKLPGVNGNMSVNLPFILFAAATLSAFEALVIGILSTAMQSLPRGGNEIKPVQAIFNLSTMVVAVGLASGILHGGAHVLSVWASASRLLVLAGAGLLLAQTFPVAAIISLTEGGSLYRIWFHIFQLSFPYYVLSTGITSLMTTISQHIGWQIPLLTLLVMYGIYRSYGVYFRGVGARPSPPLRARAAATS